MRKLLRVGPLVFGVAEVRPVTEFEAYNAVLGHRRSCPVCSESDPRTGDRGRRCSTGLELEARWKALERQQSPPALTGRR